MKGIGKRVAVAILSIVTLLSVSGLISLFELNDLRGDAEAALAAGGQEAEVVNSLLRSLHNHSSAVIDVALSEDVARKGDCDKALDEIDVSIASVHEHASMAMKLRLDTMAMYSKELRRITDELTKELSARRRSVSDELPVLQLGFDGRLWYIHHYEPTYNQFVAQVQSYSSLVHERLSLRVANLSKNAHRSVVPVFISLLVMIAVVLMFYYFIYIYGVKPIIRINRSLSEYLRFKLPYKANAEMIDEIKELNGNIENLVNISRSNQKQEEDAL